MTKKKKSQNRQLIYIGSKSTVECKSTTVERPADGAIGKYQHLAFGPEFKKDKTIRSLDRFAILGRPKFYFDHIFVETFSGSMVGASSNLELKTTEKYMSPYALSCSPEELVESLNDVKNKLPDWQNYLDSENIREVLDKLSVPSNDLDDNVGSGRIPRAWSFVLYDGFDMVFNHDGTLLWSNIRPRTGPNVL